MGRNQGSIDMDHQIIGTNGGDLIWGKGGPKGVGPIGLNLDHWMSGMNGKDSILG